MRRKYCSEEKTKREEVTDREGNVRIGKEQREKKRGGEWKDKW